MAKTANGLMRHLRDRHNIEINGSRHKQQLLNMGYYHGYKGYRFIKNSTNRIPFTKFEEVAAIYDFDMRLKTVFYPTLMTLETALKNRTLDCIIEQGPSDFEYVFSNLLNDYKSENTGNSKYRDKMKTRLKLKDSINESITYAYGKNKPVVQHFFHKNVPIPLWAVFEVITFGTFGNFVRCLNRNMRDQLTSSMGIHTTSHNQSGRLLENIIFLLTDLRNAVAHNSVIFDCRFQGDQPSADIKSFLSITTGVKDVNFQTIADYLILVVYLRKLIGTSKNELRSIIKDFEKAVEELRENVPVPVHASLLGSDIRKKITGAISYVNR